MVKIGQEAGLLIGPRGEELCRLVLRQHPDGVGADGGPDGDAEQDPMESTRTRYRAQEWRLSTPTPPCDHCSRCRQKRFTCGLHRLTRRDDDLPVDERGCGDLIEGVGKAICQGRTTRSTSPPTGGSRQGVDEEPLDSS